MPEYTGGQAGLFKFRISVHDSAGPAEVDCVGTYGPAARHNARPACIVSDRIEYFSRVPNPGIDNLDRRNHVFGGPQHIQQTHTRSLQRLAEHESEFDLDPRNA